MSSQKYGHIDVRTWEFTDNESDIYVEYIEDFEPSSGRPETGDFSAGYHDIKIILCNIRLDMDGLSWAEFNPSEALEKSIIQSIKNK